MTSIGRRTFAGTSWLSVAALGITSCFATVSHGAPKTARSAPAASPAGVQANPNYYSSAYAVSNPGRSNVPTYYQGQQNSVGYSNSAVTPHYYIENASNVSSMTPSSRPMDMTPPPQQSRSKRVLKSLWNNSGGQAVEAVKSVGSRVRLTKNSGEVHTGAASWYGTDFHGGRTASGERYDMNSMTAAHRTLPFGTLVKVKNLVNGRECVVRINNRGPFIKGRILDMSKAAASELGFMARGIAKVQMQVLGKGE